MKVKKTSRLPFTSKFKQKSQVEYKLFVWSSSTLSQAPDLTVQTEKAT